MNKKSKNIRTKPNSKLSTVKKTSNSGDDFVKRLEKRYAALNYLISSGYFFKHSF